MEKMKKLIMFVVLCLCFVNVVYAQGERCQYKSTDVDINLSNGETVLRSTKQPITGVVCRYYGNGNVWYETPFKDGKPEGIERWYTQSGNLEYESSYLKGKRIEGTEKSYTYNDNKTIKCAYRINGICTTEDIGGVQAYKVQVYKASTAPSLSEIDRQIAVLNALLSMPVSTPDYRALVQSGGFWSPQELQQAIQNNIQMERLNQQRYQTQLQTLLQERARQVNQQTANQAYRLKFENYNNFTVSVLFEVHESGIGGKRTGTVVLGAKETKEITDTFVDPKNIVLITRRLSN